MDRCRFLAGHVGAKPTFITIYDFGVVEFIRGAATMQIIYFSEQYMRASASLCCEIGTELAEPSVRSHSLRAYSIPLKARP